MILEDYTYESILQFVLKGTPYREIANILQVSKNTVTDLVNRLVNTGSIFPLQNRVSIYDPVINDIQEHILGYLQIKKMSVTGKKTVGLKNDEIYLLLLAQGYNISKSKAYELITRGRKLLKESYLSIVHVPGRAVEFDWGTMNIQIGKGKIRRITLAVFSFPYSNYRKAYVLPNSGSESFVIAFQQFIKDMQGIPPLFVFDNMRIARNFNIKEDSIQLTQLFDDLTKHYHFEAHFCSPHCPNQKGNVENNVGIIKNAIKDSYVTSFASMDEFTKYVNIHVDNLNKRKHPVKSDTCENLIHHEKFSWSELPTKEYCYYQQDHRKVNKQGMINFKNNAYSVEEVFKGAKVPVHFSNKTLYIFSPDGSEVIAKYALTNVKKRKKHRVWYMLHKLKDKENGFLDSEEYKSLTKVEKYILHKIFETDVSAFLEFLKLIKGQSKKKLRKFMARQKYDLGDEDKTPDILVTKILRL